VSADDLLAFMRRYRLGVQASIAGDSAPQAAVVGIAITDRFEIVFDTLESTRKLQNLRRNPRIAFVIGGVTVGEERTVQYEGIADEPSGGELEALKAIYYAAYPDGPSRLAWPGLTYVRVVPRWIRYSDFSANPPLIVEFAAADLV
jgi:Pyridoxamine 5'-phosphate oxidase